MKTCVICGAKAEDDAIRCPVCGENVLEMNVSFTVRPLKKKEIDESDEKLRVWAEELRLKEEMLIEREIKLKEREKRLLDRLKRPDAPQPAAVPKEEPSTEPVDEDELVEVSDETLLRKGKKIPKKFFVVDDIEKATNEHDFLVVVSPVKNAPVPMNALSSLTSKYGDEVRFCITKPEICEKFLDTKVNYPGEIFVFVHKKLVKRYELIDFDKYIIEILTEIARKEEEK